MPVGIDAHMVGQRDTGNETYIANLVRGLAEVDSPFDFKVYVTNEATAIRELLQGTRVRLERLRPGMDAARLAWTLPRALRRADVRLLHVTYVAPIDLPCPTVVTVHDVAYALFPELYPGRTRLLLSCMVPMSLRRAAHIIAVSEQTKQDLMRVYSIPESRITVTGEAVWPGYTPIHDEGVLRSVCAKYGLRRPFLLTVGNLEPRKNLVQLVHAYASYLQAAGSSYQLALVGQPKWRAAEVTKAVRLAGLEERVVFTGYVPAPDLQALYSAAHLVVYPSIYEGFGLPPLEAMACGTPVVTSGAGALSDTVGDAALLIDPLDVGSLAEGIRRGIEDGDLRRELVARGKRRAQGFSCSELAERTIAVYRNVLGLAE